MCTRSCPFRKRLPLKLRAGCGAGGRSLDACTDLAAPPPASTREMPGENQPVPAYPPREGLRRCRAERQPFGGADTCLANQGSKQQGGQHTLNQKHATPDSQMRGVKCPG